MPYGFTQYIAMPIAVIVLVLAQSLIVIVRAWRRHPARATCGRCGYDLSASPTWQCPECGVALKQQGVRAPALRARDAVSLSQVVSAWAVIGLLAYFLGFLGVVGASIGRLATIELIRSTVHPTQVVPKWDGRPEMDVLARSSMS